MNGNLMEEAAKEIIKEKEIQEKAKEHRVCFIVEPLRGLTNGQRRICISIGPFFETGVMSKVLEILLEDTNLSVKDHSSGIPYTNSMSFICAEVLYKEYKDGEEKVREEDIAEIENAVRELLEFLVNFVNTFSKMIKNFER